MGHERIGVLPKTEPWRKLVGRIAAFSGAAVDVPSIASTTLENVRSRFESIQRDSGMKAALKFLVALSMTAGSRPGDEPPYGLDISGALSPLTLAKALHNWVSDNEDSPEYGELAQAAGTDAIAIWYNHNTRQGTLFSSHDQRRDIWRRASTGTGFCELARLFFAKFTERYLNYFLGRHASISCRTAIERDLMASQLRDHIDAVSRHAFETAKIAESFAAGWFNRHAREAPPSDREVESFLSIAFGKIREELRRQGNSP